MKDKDNTKKDAAILEYEKKLVIARIDAQVPSNLRLSIGSYGRLSKEEMIRHVRAGDETGRQIIDSHLRFLRAQSEGRITKALVSTE